MVQQGVVIPDGIKVMGLMLTASCLWGCPTILISDPETVSCTAEGETCGTQGDLRCSADNSWVEYCQEDSKGCLRWLGLARCGSLQTCRLDDLVPRCVCLDECTNEGGRRCRGGAIQVCAANENGCLSYLTLTDCADEGLACSSGDHGPVCRRSCDECDAEGNSRCHDNSIERCALDDDGCLSWVQRTSCDEGGGICDDSRSVPFCACIDECSVEDETRCREHEIHRCVEGRDHCLDWVVVQDCEEIGGSCDDSGSEPECECDICGPIGATRCQGDRVQRCLLNDDGCQVWEQEHDCGVEELLCDEVGAEFACVCPEGCPEEGISRCEAEEIQRCLADERGCLQWHYETSCSHVADLCETSGAEAICVCSDECRMEGASRCFLHELQRCVLGGDGCLDWVRERDCRIEAEICDGTGAEPRCTCASHCPELGDATCVGDLLLSCVTAENGCREWVVVRDCSEDERRCEGGGAEPACTCPDEECVMGDERCRGAKIQRCQLDDSECPVWVTIHDCLTSGATCDEIDSGVSCI